VNHRQSVCRDRGHAARGIGSGGAPDGKGVYFVTLPQDVLDKLNYLRGPGESCSDVILRLAKGDAVR
jgi:hypothetical protein